jgi:adenine-specific DNA-methyltransferase
MDMRLNIEENKLSFLHTQGGIDSLRLIANENLSSENKKKLGQFMTPTNIANFMANLFEKSNIRTSKLLDCGAGIGSLTIPAIQKLSPSSTEAWEIDPIMSEYLKDNVKDLNCIIHTADFIEESVKNIIQNTGTRFTYAILNPPYKKIINKSHHRLILKEVGIETVNLYTAFLALTILLMEDDGQIIAIIPRSFCNGLYYKPFRKLLLRHCSIKHIHIFDSRTKQFKDDKVLQENIIIKLVKNQTQSDIIISVSKDNTFSDYQELKLPFDHVVKSNNTEYFIHIPTTTQKQSQDYKSLFEYNVSELGLQVSTGPVVDFRVKDYWLQNPTNDSFPLLYPHHFIAGKLHYPRVHKKPNALMRRAEISKLLLPRGFYVVVKRFSSKEERKRIVAYVINPEEIESEFIGFENHWNVFHFNKKGIDSIIARGLVCFLNSTLVDNYFRTFSGHTQVNATDLKNIKYPSLEKLRQLGQKYQATFDQKYIDQLITEIS